MKSKYFISLIIFFMLSGINYISAQSDYEIVKSFKEKATSIEKQIKEADSLAALKQAEGSIDKLKRDFIANKELLNRGLYPDNFDLTFQKLKNEYELRKNDFTQIEGLNTEVTVLKVEVDTLSRRNNELTLQFEELEKQTNEMIDQLERDIANLSASLKKRDLVVMNMIDSLLPPSYRDGENLSSEEKQQFLSEAEQNNVLYNIKRAVNDNIRFLNATKLHSHDIEDLKNRQYNFFRIWRSVGPTMVEIYAEKGKSTNELKEIDEAFSRWHSELNREVWESIRTDFAKNDIRLQNFSTGKEFTSVITNYINDEIRNTDNRNNSPEKIYNKFVDSTWYNQVKPEWVSFLIDNKMLEEKDKDTIEVLMSSWKSSVYPDGINWIYIVLAILIIALAIFFFARRSKTKPETRVSGESS